MICMFESACTSCSGPELSRPKARAFRSWKLWDSPLAQGFWAHVTTHLASEVSRSSTEASNSLPKSLGGDLKPPPFDAQPLAAELRMHGHRAGGREPIVALLPLQQMPLLLRLQPPHRAHQHVEAHRLGARVTLEAAQAPRRAAPSGSRSARHRCALRPRGGPPPSRWPLPRCGSPPAAPPAPGGYRGYLSPALS